MNGKISVGQGIAIAGIWLAIAVVSVMSLPFAVLILPIAVPVAAAWGGVVATKLILASAQYDAIARAASLRKTLEEV